MKWFFENFAAGVFRFVVSWILWNWVWIIGLLTAGGIGAWAAINRTGYVYSIGIAATAFVVVLWSSIGLSWIYAQQNRFDWTLAYTGMTLGLDPGNDDATLQISIGIANVGAAPLKYKFDEFRVSIEDRTIPTPKFDNEGGIIPRGISRNYKFPSFRKQTVQDFLGKRISGTVEYTILYGPHDSAPVRKLKMKHSVALRLDDKFGLVDTIISESEDDVY